MASDPTIQDANLGKIFDALDVTKDGIISAADFTALAEGVVAQLVPDAEEHRRQDITTSFLGWWAQIERDADADGDGQVSREEFITATEAGLAGNPEYLDEAYAKLAETVFEALDRNGDGEISRDEYIALYLSAEVSAEIAATAFERIDQNGDGVIDYAEFRAALQELFTTSDSAAPGAGLLG
ncbi:EF-hand domain-containing protein [Crossiella cryophila]|uniref:Ca2+-binding EF-hand superfamily protein n=1 Tax=Crossiella cryophila TaxID=43355 RepID=A0A7W7CD79_9PSEU|nr:EF-hand domain-containing protein [Crossiella cryophila]MBB4677703.1 Ca2+-binding EF-hand superfamily protein [Crossiella cryophila]